MSNYPIQTNLHLEQRTDLKVKYIHIRPAPSQDQEICSSEHRTIAAAYNCRKNSNKSDQIIFSCRNSYNYQYLERYVEQDELVVNQVIRPTRLHHALLETLKLSEQPLREYEIKRHKSEKPYHTEPTTHRLFLLIQEALLIHHFYTTPLPQPTENEYNKYTNKYTALLPLEQLGSFQRDLEPIIEETKNQAKIYNETHRLQPEAPRVLDLLNYSLEPCEPNPAR